jgi:Zn-dependent protease/CBS domain-containing protein
MLKSSFRLFTIRGIEVGVHYSWLIIFALVTWSLSVYIFPTVPDIPRLASVEFWILGAVTSVLLFASVLVHELAHSFVANWRGLEAKSITLFIFGGVSNLSGDAKDAATEFVVAIVGPLMSFALAAITFALASVIDEPRASLVLSYLFFINVTLGIFNLVPGFPLDGGRVLRSIIWRVTGNVRRATEWAASIGKVVAFVMFGYAVYLVVVGGSIIGGVWTAAIAWFLYNAARTSVEQLVFEQRLGHLHVRDVASYDTTTVGPNTAVSELVDRYILAYARRAVPVVDEGRMVGVVTVNDIATIPPERRAFTTVGQVMSGRSELYTTNADATVLEAFEVMSEHDLEQLPVMDGDQPIGLLTRADVARLLRVKG